MNILTIFLEPPPVIAEIFPDQIVSGLVKSSAADETDYNIFS